jgi:hypothetical protein
VVVLLLESHVTPFPVLPEYSSGHLLLAYLQDMFPEDSYLKIDQCLLVSPWFTKVSGPFWSSGHFCRGTAFRPWPLKGLGRGFSLLGRTCISWLLNVPSACLAFDFAFFNFRLVHPDKAF